MTDLPGIYCDAVIDVSHWNGAIDWPAVAAAGIVLAFIKTTQGSGSVDPIFERNRDAATKAGILVVPYHFLDASDPAAQAKHFLATVGAERGMSLMLDWEQAGVPASALVAVGNACQAATGVAPICYYGYSMLAASDATLSVWPLMLPAYPRSDSGKDYPALVTQAPRLPPGRSATRPYDFHQYTAKGRIPGISGDVDRSIWVGLEDELRSFISGAPPAAVGGDDAGHCITAPPPVAEPPKPSAESITDADVVEAVKELQRRATATKRYRGQIDGICGPQTAAAAIAAYNASRGVN